MRVDLSETALDDLSGIGAFIGETNPLRAETFVEEIRERCLGLGSMPRAFPLVPRHEGTGVRRCPFRAYLIFYRIRTDVVEILRVVHGSRDIDALLFPGGDDG